MRLLVGNLVWFLFRWWQFPNFRNLEKFSVTFFKCLVDLTVNFHSLRIFQSSTTIASLFCLFLDLGSVNTFSSFKSREFGRPIGPNIQEVLVNGFTNWQSSILDHNRHISVNKLADLIEVFWKHCEVVFPIISKYISCLTKCNWFFPRLLAHSARYHEFYAEFRVFAPPKYSVQSIKRPQFVRIYLHIVLDHGRYHQWSQGFGASGSSANGAYRAISWCLLHHLVHPSTNIGQFQLIILPSKYVGIDLTDYLLKHCFPRCI